MLGDPPAPQRNVKRDRAKHNALLLEIGATEAFHRGLINAQDYSRVDRALNEITAKTKDTPGDLEHLDNHWLYGKTGTGKSRMARAKWPGAYLKDITKWWDHYNDQPAIIIEDLDPDHKYLARQLKIWSDRYPFSPEHKGSYLPPIRPKHVIVTS